MKLLLWKSIINLLQKSETKIFKQKWFHKNLFKVNEKKTRALFNNKQMFAVKLLANLAVASDCYIRFWTCLNTFLTFHISHITWGIIIIIDRCWKLLNHSKLLTLKISKSILVKASKTFSRNVLIEKNKDMGSEKNTSTRFRWRYKLFQSTKEEQSC